MNFSQAEDQFRQLQAQFEAGQLTEGELRARLQDLMVQDEQGNWWVLGYETGRWYRHDGTDWIAADPPGSAVRGSGPVTAAKREPARASGAQIGARRKPQAVPGEKQATHGLRGPLLSLLVICVAALGATYYLLPGFAQARVPAPSPTATKSVLRPSQTAELASQIIQTSEPVPTAQAELQVRIAVSRATMYQGPGLDYAMADSNWHLKGEELAVTARDPSGTWLLTRAADGIEGWLYFQWVATDFDVSAVPTASSIPVAPPPPARKRKENSCPAPPGCQVWDPVACVCNG